ncbi:putative NRPS-like protein biosynthetic cluster [Trichoderma atroviride]|uniref:Carrier domain-containing protein n=1 Tax=Hypocrea atroviridis (strain ATCC 20476 / IMI 206040) TaxID=452589 RepID=G9NZ20_HYPAI|nr:uncharacterized protein TRIATDRAFT_87599 [Trichoderma atroviride IMI 206040]EHK44571.1 hypothetical protein TRIATDRAFT_87599 [Trichoderma atroviride IMI 206040]UKZ67972.1 putative NRPS-like protein biosynthetic cluster [Trichoderma atroviride]
MASLESLRQIWADVLGIENDKFTDSDNFMTLGGNSIKAIQFLGEIASFIDTIDLATFLNNATFKNIWDTISAYQQSVNGETAKKSTRIEPIETMDSIAADSMVGISSGQLASALERVGVAEDDVTQVAPVSSIQEFFLHHQQNGGTGCINYIYEVEGPNLKQGLKQFTHLLEMKNPIFRTTIISPGENKFALALLKETASHWSYPSSLRSLLDSTTAQKLQLGAPAARYALVLGDAAHQGRNFFAISLYHTHCDAFTRFLIDKEISQILQSPFKYAGAENIERPWFGAFVKHQHLIAPQEEVMKFWENYLRGANVANIHPLDQAVVSGSVENVLKDMLPVPFSNPQPNGDTPRNPTQVILAAWAMALAKLSGHRDITFGLCRHGRSSNTFADVWRVMGPLVNAVPFRISVQSKQEPITELLQRVQDDITTTTKWEQGFAPGVVPSADGRPWVQSFVNLRSELNKSKDVCGTDASDSDVTKIVPRPDLDNFNTDYHWAVILMVKRQRNQYEVSMLYNSSLIDHRRANTLFADFKSLMSTLEADVDINVGSLLDRPQVAL